MRYQRSALLLFVLWLPGCLCLDPWTRYPNRVPPDHSYSTGGSVYGDDVYVWDGRRANKLHEGRDSRVAGG